MNVIVQQQFRDLRRIRAVREVELTDLVLRFAACPPALRAELLAVVFVDGIVSPETIASGVDLVAYYTPDPARDLPVGLWSALLRVAGLSPVAVFA